tara:strand:- start:9256 stop:9402 length:147 start_codon:yes stop_codon:yes gene_type:complete
MITKRQAQQQVVHDRLGHRLLSKTGIKIPKQEVDLVAAFLRRLNEQLK